MRHSTCTRDGVQISIREFKSPIPSQTCVVVAPGFAQHSSTKIFESLCLALAESEDVFCLDFRGTGKSGGRFTFGAWEHQDIAATLSFIKSNFNYDKIKLLGFSLGAYASLRATCEAEFKPDELFLVSCPTSVDEIIWGGSAVKHMLRVFSDKSLMEKERELWFRWHFPFLRKPCATEFAADLKIPTHFLSGTGDFLTPLSMSKRVHERVHASKRSWLEFESKRHAEQLYFTAPAPFMKWFQTARILD